MDEIEWRMAYNEACKSAERITAPETKTTNMLILQLVHALFVMIDDLHEEDADE
jgi:hypothetical protein